MIFIFNIYKIVVYSRLGEMISDVVNKYGIVWVVSGSNHGPALSTVGTPPNIATSSLIGEFGYKFKFFLVHLFKMFLKMYRSRCVRES